jgi:diguanylate cyclase (GGDEF)-like protein/PAS domain S-box-containing protein
MGVAGLVIGVYALCLLFARKLVDSGKWRSAVALMCSGLLTSIVIILPLQPRWSDALAVIPLSVVALALPYTSNRVFHWVLVACWIVSAVVILGAEFLLLNAVPETLFDRMFRLSAVIMTIAVVLFLLWQVSSRLNDALARTQEAEERYSVAVRGANDGIWDWDLKQRIIYYSPRWKEMLGLHDHEITDTINEWYDRVHPDDRPLLQEAIKAHINGEKDHLEHEYRVRCQDRSYRWMLCRGLAIRDENGSAIRVAGSQTDITKRKQAEEQLRHDSMHDALTGLPNRSLFMDRLSQMLERTKRHAQPPFAVLFLDLDRFKIINDSLGHLVGDMLLKVIAQRLTEGMRQGDTVARLGGDEFAVLLTELPNANTAVDVADRIQHAVGEPFKLDTHEVFTTASIGIAVSSSGYNSADDMVRDADIAMYRAKLLGKARAVVFDHDMHAHVLSRLQIENDLRRGIEREEFAVFYQPLVSLHNGKICGFEALLRWNHPEHGMVPPAGFLSIAEEAGLIVPIGAWLLQEACRQIAVWQKRYPQYAPLSISVNLSGTQVMYPQLVTQVAQVLRETGLCPQQMALEITEGVILDRDGMVTATLKSLRELGTQLHLDDFGTGYASLISLHDLPISAVKIDRTFVSTMDEAPKNSAIVRAIVALSQNLGLEVIAEGVETATHLAALHTIGCDYGQGYYFSKPQDAASAEALLATTQHWQRDDHEIPEIALPTIPHQKAFPSTAVR